MAYVALYRQWRPQDFDSLVGQSHVSMTLKNALAAGRVAHAYLFSGPRGTGKTSAAKILAKALNCETGVTPSPCGQCSACRRIAAGASMDVFEIDAASNRGIDEIRDLREQVKFASAEGRYKVYIIDEVHMLTPEAFNALLKTLEEPPAFVVFVLATTEPHKIPATIHSRCQRYDFRRISVADIEARLAQIAAGSGFEAEPDALRLIAARADGGLRDAISILDQCASLENGRVTVEGASQLLGLVGEEWLERLADGLAARDMAAVLGTLDEMLALGKDVRQLLLELGGYFRDLMVHKAAPGLALERSAVACEAIARQAALFTDAELADALVVLNSAAGEAKWAAEARIAAEVALLKICRRDAAATIAALMARVEALEKKIAAMPAPAAAAAVSPTPLSGRRAEPAGKAPQPAPPAFPGRPAAGGGKAFGRLAADPAAKEISAAFEAPEHTGGMGRPHPGTGPAAPRQDLKRTWDAVMAELRASGKLSIHACVSKGQLAALEESRAVVQFPSAFYKERTEKEDYREIVEKILTKICARPVRLVCEIEGWQDSGIAAVGSQPEDAAEPAGPAGQTYPPGVLAAHKLFGGTIIEED